MPLAYVRAYDMMLIALVSSLFVYGLAKYEQFVSQHQASKGQLDNGKKPPIGWRFNLNDLMFGMILLSVLTATLSQTLVKQGIIQGDFPIQSPIKLVVIGLTTGLWSIGLIAICNRRLNTRTRKLVFTIAFLGSLLCFSWSGRELVQSLRLFAAYMGDGPLFAIPTNPPSNIMTVTSLSIFLLIVSLLTFFVTWSFQKSKPYYKTTNLTKSNRISRRAIGCGRQWLAPLFSIILVLAMTIPLLLLFVALLPPNSNIHRVRQYQTGQPNGLPELISAGRKFDQSVILNQWQPVRPGPELKAEIAKYSKEYSMIDSGLSKPNCTWIDWSTGKVYGQDSSQSYFSNLIDFGIILRDVGRALDTRALQSIFDKQYDQVIEDGIRCIRVAETLSTDGCNLTVLIGAAIEGIGIHLMYPAIANASETQLISADKYLDQLIQNAGRTEEQYDRMIDNDALFMWEQTSWMDRGTDAFDTDHRSHLRTMLVRMSIIRKLLHSEIALERFHNKHGKYPNTLQELVPTYLRAIPLDPGAAESEPTPLNYSYSAANESFQLYSIGVDGIDNDGHVDKHQYGLHGDISLSIIVSDPITENEEDVSEFERENELYEEELEEN